jgi:hypothetical protein
MSEGAAHTIQRLQRELMQEKITSERCERECKRLRWLIERALKWEPTFPLEAGLADEMAAAVKSATVNG